jgi:nudix-type nucleoside diphosphatase (YffH/AdpP family)
VSDDRVHIVSSEVLIDDWARLTKYTIDFKRSDGRVERQIRQVYDRGDGATILPIDPVRKTVLLIRQFRMPVYLTDKHGFLIEACAGLLDENDPETTIHKEAEEELGYRIKEVRRVLVAYGSPGSVKERLFFFLARYAPADRISAGGGAAHEGEDIEVIELPLAEALAMVKRGEIHDAKTVILLQHVALFGAEPAAGFAGADNAPGKPA